MPSLTIRRAGVADAEALAPLFDAYRQFYDLALDPVLSRDFLRRRLRDEDSVVFVATLEGEGPVGFVQLYPSYCSLAADRIFVLYDLWVDPGARRAGAGRALMIAARDYAQRAGAARLDLMTARTNVPAQRLYESLGWVRDERFYPYSLRLGGSPPAAKAGSLPAPGARPSAADAD
jgi:ribosomal protein S18 acetylase RimI-like enzyme